jgi:hypothetical protein
MSPQPVFDMKDRLEFQKLFMKSDQKKRFRFSFFGCTTVDIRVFCIHVHEDDIKMAEVGQILLRKFSEPEFHFNIEYQILRSNIP